MTLIGTRNWPEFPGFSDPLDVAPLIAPTPPGGVGASSEGVAPRGSRARESRARDCTPIEQRFDHAG
jgi:hypothetical protein